MKLFQLRFTLIIAVCAAVMVFSACSERDVSIEKSDSVNTESIYLPLQSASSHEFKAGISNEPKLLDEFDPEQRYFINLSKSLYIVKFNLGENISDVEKAGFFKFIISTDCYADRLKDWKKEDADAVYYEIPLADIEQIVFSHLNTQEFDPLVGFVNKDKSESEHFIQWYDTKDRAYITSNIGGYGGAAALGVLNCETTGNKIEITLGSYDMDKFYQNPPQYELVETYDVIFLKQSDKLSDFKIISSEILDGID